MNTAEQISAAITNTLAEIRDLNEKANSLSLLHYRLQSVSAGIHLGSHSKADLQAIQDEITAAVAARDTIPTKTAALRMLEKELEDTIATRRREDCHELAARFDSLKADYTAKSDELLTMFRQMHSMHAQYLGLTGRALLNDVDYLLMLPTTMQPYDSPQHSTGSIVRAAPLRNTA
jgi:chromosome segregation ATPase